ASPADLDVVGAINCRRILWPILAVEPKAPALPGPGSAGLVWQARGTLAILHRVPANETRAVQIYRASLTTREQRELGRAEHTIAKGLKAFLAVGMALKEIRDKRLYRQHYDTFEDY